MTHGHFGFSLFFLLGLSNLYNFKVKGGFMEEAGYDITKKEFNDVNHWVESIYNTVVVVDYFFQFTQEQKGVAMTDKVYKLYETKILYLITQEVG